MSLWELVEINLDANACCNLNIIVSVRHLVGKLV